jgi:hypothetical protein
VRSHTSLPPSPFPLPPPSPSPLLPPSQVAPLLWPADNYQSFWRIASSDVADMYRGVGDATAGLISGLPPSTSSSSSSPASSTPASPHRTLLRQMAAGKGGKSLTYGEVLPSSIEGHVIPAIGLESVAPSPSSTPTPDAVFVDLGSGTCKIPVQVALWGVGRGLRIDCRGIELAADRHAAGVEAISRLSTVSAGQVEDELLRVLAEGGTNTTCKLPGLGSAAQVPAVAARVVASLRAAAPLVRALKADILTTPDYEDASHVFVNNTVFEPPLMVPLVARLAALRKVKGLVVLRALCARHSGRCESTNAPCRAYSHPPVQGVCNPTWDDSTTIFAYTKAVADWAPDAPGAGPPALIRVSSTTPGATLASSMSAASRSGSAASSPTGSRTLSRMDLGGDDREEGGRTASSPGSPLKRMRAGAAKGAAASPPQPAGAPTPSSSSAGGGGGGGFSFWRASPVGMETEGVKDAGADGDGDDEEGRGPPRLPRRVRAADAVPVVPAAISRKRAAAALALRAALAADEEVEGTGTAAAAAPMTSAAAASSPAAGPGAAPLLPSPARPSAGAGAPSAASIFTPAKAPSPHGFARRAGVEARRLGQAAAAAMEAEDRREEAGAAGEEEGEEGMGRGQGQGGASSSPAAAAPSPKSSFAGGRALKHPLPGAAQQGGEAAKPAQGTRGMRV